jgi:two-component system sensor histidine kinase BaeS
MIKTLRNRLILSHVLPMLVIIPLIGLALTYILESRVLLPGLANELVGDAQLFADIASEQVEIWQNPLIAQALLNQASPNFRARVLLLTSSGKLLAASQPEELQSSNISSQDLAALKNGGIVTHINYSRQQKAEIINVLAPVNTSNHVFVGIVQMSYHFDSVAQDFYQLRYLVFAVVALGLLAGAGMGYALAVSIDRPIQQATQAVVDLSYGEQVERLPEEGPVEIQSLLKAVNVLTGRLQSMEQSRRQLLANLVHELGRPLGAVRSAIMALAQGADRDPELKADLISGLDDETARLQKLVEDLSHLHGQVLGTLELDRKDFNFAEWLNRLLPTWRESALSKYLRWEESIPEKLPAIYADPVRLGQAVGNIISNAIKFTPTNGLITVSAGQAADQVWLSVQDTGPGISAEEQKKIFKPFFRGNQGRRFPQGMGLGLSITRDIMDAHGGHIELDSAPGVGTTIKLIIPVRHGLETAEV